MNADIFAAGRKKPVHKIAVTSLEQAVWDDIKAHVTLVLKRLGIEHLIEPTNFLIHQLIANMVNAMHYNVFKQTVQVDFGFEDIDNEPELNDLFNNELIEHGDRNIAKYCQNNNMAILLAFHDAEDTIVTINAPKFCSNTVHQSNKMIKTLGYQLQMKDEADDSQYCSGKLVICHKHQHSFILPTLLNQDGEQESFSEIFSQLSYSIVCFTSVGTIQSISPSILTLLKLNKNNSAIKVFARSISMHFYNDVIWGMAMEEPNGKFENYRVRIKINKDAKTSTLFNVSGFRDSNAIIHTLWQQISLGENINKLSVGGLLNEAKIHNITRNYVPQLVEIKAREVVRLGSNLLNNEECFIAVLFCDIVGFTTFVEKNENEESIIHVLNSVLRRISLSVKKYGGFIDKFMGDCVMVLFRNPHDAVMAALEMQKHSRDINQLRTRAEQDKLQLRIGIHWGKVVIGNIGIPERLDWTTIGDVVNTASRIEKKCQPDGVLISTKMLEAAVEHVENIAFRCGETFYISVKGKKEKLPVCYAYSLN